MKLRLTLTIISLHVAIAAAGQKGSTFVKGLARIESNNKSWFIDTTGAKAFDQIIQAYHPVDSVTDLHNGYLNIHDNEEEQLLIVKKDGKVGVMGNGKWWVKPDYDTIELKWKTCLVLSRNGKSVLADTRGNMLVPLEFEDVGAMDDDHFDVKQHGKWGVYSVSAKKLVIPAEYEKFDYCGGCGRKSDYAYARKNGKWGVVSFTNIVLIPFEYDHEHFSMRSDEWVKAFTKNGKKVVVNIPQQKVYGEPEYTDVEVIGNSMLVAKKNGKYGLIARDGQQLLDYSYDAIKYPYADFVSGPLIQVSKNGKTGLVNNNGKILTDLKFSGDVFCYDDLYAVVPLNGGFNLADTSGNLLLKNNYNAIESLKAEAADGSAVQRYVLKQKALYGLYNPASGKLVEPAFHEVEAYTDHDNYLPGTIEVIYKQQKGLYTVDGVLLLPPAYEEYRSVPGLATRFLEVKTTAGRGLYDTENKKLVVPPAAYESITALENDSTLIEVGVNIPAPGYGTRYGLYNQAGDKLLEPVYNYILQVAEKLYLLESQKGEQHQYALYNLSTKKISPLPYTIVSGTPAKGILNVSDGSKSFLWNVVTGKSVSAAFPMTDNGTDAEKTSGISWFQSGVAVVRTNNKAGFVDVTGKTVVPVDYDDVAILPNGALALFRKKPGDERTSQWLYGFADSTGRIIVPVEYERASSNYPDDLAVGKYLMLQKADGSSYGHKLGLASLDGKVIITPGYEKIMIEANGKGFLGMNGSLFTILGINGQPVATTQYNDLMLDETVFSGATIIKYSFPALCRIGESYEYVTADGKVLPVKITEQITFAPPEEMDTVEQ